MVSAVLIFTLFSTAFLLWTVQTLPEWVADREHNHARDAAGSLSSLGAELDATTIGQDASVRVDLAPARIPLVQVAAASGELNVEDGFRFTATYTGEAAFMVGGAMVATPAAGAFSADVATLRAVELAYDGSGNNQAGSVAVTAFRDDDGDGIVDAAETSVQSVLGMRAGSQTTPCGNGNREAYLEVRTGVGGSPAIVATHILACDPSNAGTFTVNLLAEEYRFRSLLGRLGNEFTLTSASAGAGTGRIAAVYTDLDGATRAFGTPSALDLDTDLESGRLKLVSLYQHTPQRTLVYEGGGVVSVQDAGSAFLQPPVFTAVQEGGQGYLRWRLVDIAGQASVAGTDSATVRLTKTAVTEHVVAVDAGETAVFGLETAAPGAWQQLWTDARVLAGFDVADMTVATGAGSATLTLGNIPWTVHLTVIHADASVT